MSFFCCTFALAIQNLSIIMKKILSILALAAVVFGFSACEGSGGLNPLKEGFNVSADGVMDVSAIIQIEAKSKKVTYFWACYPLDSVKNMTIEDLTSKAHSELLYRKAEDEANQGKQLPLTNYLSKGRTYANLDNLQPATDYVFVVVGLDEYGQRYGGEAQLGFQTLDLIPRDEQTFELEGSLVDYTEEGDPRGFYIMAEKTFEDLDIKFRFDARSNTLEGNFTLDDFVEGTTFFIVNGWNEGFYSLDFHGHINTSDHTYIFEGVAVGWNRVRYNLTIVCPIE
jgi:hypothetical protein